MCGITGFWSEGTLSTSPRDVLRRMTDTLRHRGPDDEGQWTDPDAGVALGHRRLSILDLSPEGHQPMASHGGRYVVVFNGEVYNFEEIRRELADAGAAPPFRGHSDTEVMLAAFEAWGVESAVGRFVGMFAFALWDRRERTLHLVRDRLGIKPLYYGWAGGSLVFGSELKALRAFPGFAAEVDRGAVALFLRHSYVPAPHTVYRGIHKLLPGSILSLRAPGERAAPRAFWSARETAESGLRDPLRGSDAELADGLDARLREAVRLRMIADVPVGAFLSGGIDSSVVVALMQAESARPVQTFTIGSTDAAYDEADHAREVARHLGTDHHELYVSPEDALAVIPDLPAMYDEPFGDSSQIPTFLVSRLARGRVTVSLSGDGGDELFAGYNRHVWGQRIWRRAGWIPRPARSAGSRLLGSVAPGTWDRAYSTLSPVLPRRMRHRYPGYKVHKLAEVIGSESPEAMYRALVSQWKSPGEVVSGAREPRTVLSEAPLLDGRAGFTERMMYLDLVSYLPDDILTKVDRASMAVSLEARVPLLDHRVVEYAWRLPLDVKLRDGTGKWILRQVLQRYVPRELVERPKAGFGVPLGEWLRGPLRGWAEELLDPRALREQGFFRPEAIRGRWDEHLAGRRSWEHPLWNVLMFQAWLRTV
ncbi:MAG: asparagine synthase (glutamine-hydrolyzing) [Gemmatimonadota bacterium]